MELVDSLGGPWPDMFEMVVPGILVEPSVYRAKLIAGRPQCLRMSLRFLENGSVHTKIDVANNLKHFVANGLQILASMKSLVAEIEARPRQFPSKIEQVHRDAAFCHRDSRQNEILAGAGISTEIEVASLVGIHINHALDNTANERGLFLVRYSSAF